MGLSFDDQSVFLNVPYDRGYEPLFITLVASIICLGLKPRCVLEIKETGQGRLPRIQQLIESCRTSIHDLSRVGTPVRFNMPFELGLACNIARHDSAHQLVVMERKPYRLDKTLSDYKGRDLLIHAASCERLVSCILDTFVTADSMQDPQVVRRVAQKLRAAASEIKKDFRRKEIFHTALYLALVSSAVELAVAEGLLLP